MAYRKKCHLRETKQKEVKYCIHTVQDEEKSMMFLLDLNIS